MPTLRRHSPWLYGGPLNLIKHHRCCVVDQNPISVKIGARNQVSKNGETDRGSELINFYDEQEPESG